MMNFLSKAVIPGRAFIRRMYNKLKTTTKKGANLKNHHHVYIDAQFRQDCKVWKLFLENANSQTIARPFIDKHMFQMSEEIEFYSDASRSPKLGFGCVYGARYTWGVWGADFIENDQPSIAFLELYALCVGIFMWNQELRNCRIVVFCDNQSVVYMLNSTTSKCPNCIHLIRILVLDGLLHNRRLSVKYIALRNNRKSDTLSRLQFD